MRKFILLVAIFGAFLPLPARAQQPEIPENIKQFWAKLAKAKTISFMAQTWDWEQHTEVAPRRYKHLRQTFEVKIQRPNRIAVLGSPAQTVEIPSSKNTGPEFRWGGSLDNVQISDGKRTLLLNTVRRTYKHTPPLKTLDDPAGDPVASLSLGDLFAKTPMDGFLPLPAASPRTDSGPTYYYSSPDPKRPGEIRFIFDKDTGYLVTLSEWYPTDKGELQEAMRLTFQHWEFDPPLPRSTFDTRQPRGYRTMQELLKELETRRSTGK